MEDDRKMRKQYLIGAKVDEEVVYMIAYNPDAAKYEYYFGNKLKKPDFVIELPDEFSKLEKLIKNAIKDKKAKNEDKRKN